MGMWDKIFGEFVDVIEWTDDSNDTMVYRFDRYGNEIKYGAKLTVRETQTALFVNEGSLADVLTPGMYELETKNLPVLSTIQHWDHGFKSPFKAEVYFCNMTQFTDLKWGTKNPIMVRDEEFGGVRLRAFGTYSIRIQDPEKFIREIVGTDGHFTVDEISNQLRNLIISRFTSVTGASRIPVLDLAANYDQMSDYITDKIRPEFADYGLELTKVMIENISLPPAVEEALDKRTSMGMIGNLDQYLKYQSAEALGKGGSGGAGGAMEMGMGFAMANKMANSSFDSQPTVQTTPQRGPAGSPQLSSEEMQSRIETNSVHAPSVEEQKRREERQNEDEAREAKEREEARILAERQAVAKQEAERQKAIKLEAEQKEIERIRSLRQQNAAIESASSSSPSAPPSLAKHISPPPLMTKKWYVAINDEATGPHTANVLEELANKQHLTAQSLVWSEGMDDWTEARLHPELVKLLPA